MRLSLVVLFAFSILSAFAFPHIPGIELVRDLIQYAIRSQYQAERFWDEAHKLGPQAAEVVLNKITSYYGETTHMVEEFRIAMGDVVEHARVIREEVETHIEENNITIGHLSGILAKELSTVYEEFRDEIVDPLPEDRNERARARARMIANLMAKIRIVYVRALVTAGVPQERAEEQFDRISPAITRVLLVIGNLIDSHPVLLGIVLVAASLLILPEIPILGPIMRMFGFGPEGPIKGSPAAWLQSRFWGGFVARGSWFSILQRIGMTLTGSWLERLVSSFIWASALGFIISKFCFISFSR